MKKNYKLFLSLFVLISFLSIFQTNIVYSNHDNVSIIYGDLNDDGLVDSMDINLLKRYLLGIIIDFPNPAGKTIADLNGDGEINSMDYAIFNKYILEIITTFPIEDITTNPPSPNQLTKDEQLLFELINKERVKADLEPFILDENITHVARLLAQEMVDNNSREPEAPYDVIRENNVRYTVAGYRIATTYSVERAIEMWLKSEEQMSLIYNPSLYYTGVAVVSNGIYGEVIIQLYIRR